ncbi:MAG TPA: glucans biosynthesis glucosyltransferase MdoH [Dongiaceae bacterium]|nr:glucans biosynthesis glucosyltransferase MdoH [Dongiaceae bacterium]
MESPAAESLIGRRLAVFGLTAGTLLGFTIATAHVLGSGGWSWPRLAILILFLAGMPWTLLAFWNSLIGFVILRLVADPARFTNPALRRTPKEAPIASRTAICLAIRHEGVARVFTRLEAMIKSIEASIWSHHFAFHLLSDSSHGPIVAAEEDHFVALKARHPRPGFLHYRRRPANIGFKAGNLRDFAEHATGYDHMIVLDADSLMSADAMLRLVRVMEANPRLGILQTLVVGQPAASAFARIFQFGMRHSMRTHTTGIAWWQGPSGPYWGHNAIIRLAPFVAHCRLPLLPGDPPLGGHVLSHDQVEAALMRTAGYEVRVIADEFESWEENPPSLPDFIKRDLRWCQGNMQYLRLLARPGLRPMGRFQLLNAIFMYLGAPFWVLMLIAGLLGALPSLTAGASASYPSALAFALYIATLLIGFAPRLLGVIDILLQPDRRAAYGGAGRLIAGALIDAIFSLAMGPIMMVAQTLFLAGLGFGRRVAWQPQNRDGHRIPVGEALRGLWPQLLFGALLAAGLTALAPGGLVWAVPTLGACALAVPFACVTSGRWMGRWMMRWHLCAIPDEYAPAPEIRRVQNLEMEVPREAA